MLSGSVSQSNDNPPPYSRFDAHIAPSFKCSMGCLTPPWRSPRRPRCPRWLPRRPKQTTRAAKMPQERSKKAEEGPRPGRASRLPKRPRRQSQNRPRYPLGSLGRPQNQSLMMALKSLQHDPRLHKIAPGRPKRPHDSAKRPPTRLRKLQKSSKAAQKRTNENHGSPSGQESER